MRAMEMPVAIDLMEVSSYGAGTESSGQVRILKDLSQPIAGRHVIVVEDIIDTGLTLNYLLQYLADQGPASVRISVCSTNPRAGWRRSPIDFRGFTIPDRFVIGYGLDYDERYRNLPYIGVLKPSVYGGSEPGA